MFNTHKRAKLLKTLNGLHRLPYTLDLERCLLKEIPVALEEMSYP